MIFPLPFFKKRGRLHRLLKQGLRRSVLFRREHFYLAHDLGVEVAAEEASPVSRWPVEPLALGGLPRQMLVRQRRRWPVGVGGGGGTETAAAWRSSTACNELGRAVMPRLAYRTATDKRTHSPIAAATPPQLYRPSELLGCQPGLLSP